MVQQVRIKDYGFQQLKLCVTQCMIKKKGKLRTKQGKHHDIMQNVVVVFFFLCVHHWLKNIHHALLNP